MAQLGCISLRNLVIFIATEVVVFSIPTGVNSPDTSYGYNDVWYVHPFGNVGDLDYGNHVDNSYGALRTREDNTTC